MYAESGLMYPYFQNFCPEVQQFEDYYCSQKPNASMGSLVQTSTVSDYDLGGEGDLFKAPEPIIEQPQTPVGIDPMIAALSMISCGEDVMSSQALRVADFENGQLIMNQVLYECEKDLLAKEAMETSISDVLDIKIPVPKTFQEQIGTFQRSVSSGCLNGASLRPNFLDFPGMDFGEVYGLRRAFSEGDMKALGNANVSLLHSPLGQPQILGNDNTEDRRQKLNRYRNKKTKRNFGRKIKYACRKALADSQPRIRGRFAKTD